MLRSFALMRKAPQFVRRKRLQFSSVSKPADDIKRLLLSADAVCFDVDSTVIEEEGIDMLAEFKGAGEAVAEWTKKAMGGQVLFQDALAARLDLIKPSKSDVATFLQKNPLKLTKGVKKVMINPVAEILNIPSHRIYANNLLFNPSTGSFAGFDLNEPTSRDGGKPAVINQLMKGFGHKSVVMIGDGVTDMQAKPPAALFIGFGGVIVREKVRDGADWFISDFSELINVLESNTAE